MSNNLRQIAKDLRSFVKRCKDVHYSDSLLISFLITGLLTLAPKLQADAIAEQQEVTAQTYDTISDLRQSFMRARKENEKSLKGAQSELARLMKQGDQVIKSPWASFQYSAGFTNNDWGTTYRGRGGKYLEYFSRRPNDLTKYVFDASKHQYGATNLNVKRNEEPNSLTINPANIHEPNKPDEVYKLSSLELPKEPKFDAELKAPGVVKDRTIYYKPHYSVELTERTPKTSISEDTLTIDNPSFNNDSRNYTTNNSNTNTTNAGETLATNTSSNTATGLTVEATFTTQAGNVSKLYDSSRWYYKNYIELATNDGTISNGSFEIKNPAETYHGVLGNTWWNWWNYGGYVKYSNLTIKQQGQTTSMTGSPFSGYDDYSHPTGTVNVKVTTGTSGSEDQSRVYVAYKLMNDKGWDYNTAYANAILGGGYLASKAATSGGTNYTEYYYDSTGTGATTSVILSGLHTSPQDVQITTTPFNHNNVNTFVKTDRNFTIEGTDFTINNVPGTGTTPVKNRIGVNVAGGTLTLRNGDSATTFNINDSENAGVLVSSGTLYSNNSVFNVNGGGSAKNIGILNKDNVTLSSNTFKITGGESTGIVNENGKTLSVIGGTFTVGDNAPNSSNGRKSSIIVNDGKLSIEGGTFTIDSSADNATIITNTTNASPVEAKGSKFYVKAKHATGIKADKAKMELKELNPANQIVFNVSGDNSIGINVNDHTSAGLTIYDSGTYTVSGNSSNLIETKKGIKLKADTTHSSTFTASGPNSNIILATDDGDIDLEKGKFSASGSQSNAIITTAGKTISITAKGSKFYVTGTNSNAINNLGDGDISVDKDTYPTTPTGSNYNNSIFTIGKDSGDNSSATDYSNGIYSKAGGKVEVKYTDFNIFGNGNGQNNGIFITNSAGGATYSVDHSNFNVESGPYSNGIRSEATNNPLNVTNSTFKTKGNYNNGIYADMLGKDVVVNNTNLTVDGGIFSNAIYMKKGILDLKGNSKTNHNTITVNGTYNNGVHIEHDGNDAKSIENMTFNINTPDPTSPDKSLYAYNNGVYLGGGRIIPKITESIFNVNGNTTGQNSNVGILVGDGHGKGTISEISNTTFNIGSTNGVNDGNSRRNGTAIYMYNGDVTIKEGTKIIGDDDHNNPKVGGSDVFININNRKDNTLSMNGDIGNKLTVLRGSGPNNVGINIQNGHTADTTTLSISTPSSDYKGWNIDFTGANSIGVKNNLFADNFTLKNETDAIRGATTEPGVMRIVGDNGIMFANLGFVNTGDLQLDYINMNGQNSTGLAFLNNVYRDNVKNNTANQVDRPTVNTGIFNSANGIKVQGVIGGDSAGAINSENSVGIFANTGQRSDISAAMAGYNGGALNDLKIAGLNIGLGSLANNSTLLWSEAGTKIQVTGNSYISNGGGTSANSHISDGAQVASGTTKFGYNVDDAATSKGSFFAYATGTFSGSKQGYYNAPDIPYKSEIDLSAVKVDMVSRQGTALYADKLGKITAGDVRAGGYNSILAYATGNTGNGNHSSITINGNIVAADNNIFSTVSGYGAINSNLVASDTTKDKSYNNIGAVALDGGSVTIKGSARATSTKEGSTTNNATTSLIYGMAAYAKGDGSVVEFDDDTTNGAKVTVISGENGALYAEDHGQITFAGDIINQNNAVDKVSTKHTGSAITSITADEDRKGRGTVKDASGNIVINDHKSVTPFYVNRGANEGNSVADNAAILFNQNKTNIDMYDGVLLTGNPYGIHGNFSTGGTSLVAGQNYEMIRDYYDEDTAVNSDLYRIAKYRGMKNVTTAIMGDDYAVDLGIINQANGLKWTNDGNTNTSASTTPNYLSTIGENYAGKMKIYNNSKGTATDTNTSYGNKFKSTILNGQLGITADKVNLEDSYETSLKDSNVHNDPFNDISMESTLVTIDASTTVKGDVADGYRAGQGLNMANSLYRWETVDSTDGKSNWVKTQADQSGYINKGKINVWGGTNQNGTETRIAGMNVVFGTANNQGTGSEIKVDHGYGIFATDSSKISNEGTIEVTGQYDGGFTIGSATKSAKRSNFANDSAPSGSNYGIVGISHARANYDTDTAGNEYNKIEISNVGGKIKVEGDLAVGIYGENRANGSENALASDVNITYDDTSLGAAGVAGIDVSNANVSGNSARGVGIALVNSSTNYDNGDLNAGGVINLNGRSANFGTDNNILTGKNGVGIYAESAQINLNSPNFTVETKDNGVGLWAMDDTIIEPRANHDKTFQYFYNGAKDKNGFAMAFGGKNNNHMTAKNYLDIAFNNGNNTAVTLANEKAGINRGTSAGIAGILVNTNNLEDVVYNKGDIKEDQSKSKTYVRSYGAVVEQGTFENHGDITLAESLLSNAEDVEKADMDKVNVGIRANNLDRTKTIIKNYGDIKIGDNSATSTTKAKNIGSWAIYGTNITTGKKDNGDLSNIVINRNSYGIYSGDGNVTIDGTKFAVGNDTVLGHEQVTSPYTINRQNSYASSNDLLSKLGRKTDSAIGVYIDNNGLNGGTREHKINADMNIDRFSYGIVLNDKTDGARTDVTIGDSNNRPEIKLAYSTTNNAGGHVKSTKPHESPKWPKEINEQGNAVYYYSGDNKSYAKSWANVNMDGDYNTAYFTKGAVENYGNIDLRSQYDVDLRKATPTHEEVGYGNVGIISENTNKDWASKNFGTITTGLSDTQNMMYSVGMGAGRNHYRTNDRNEVVYDYTDGQGWVENHGTINVQEKSGIGMLATGKGSRAINYGTINLIGDDSIGMYIDREAVGINETTGLIKGNAKNLKGVIAINGGFIKNYGRIEIEGNGSTGILTDSSKFVIDANGNAKYITDTNSAEYSKAITVGEANGKANSNRGANDGTGADDKYHGAETSIEEGTSGNPKTTGVGTTISRPNVVTLTTVTIDGVQVPITNINTDADSTKKVADNITLRNSIQTGGTRIIDLRSRDQWNNPLWPNRDRDQLSEVTNIGMYIDTSGVRYTNPFNGIQNIRNLGKVNLYFGPEATLYTNAKAIRFGDVKLDDGSIEHSKILVPFNEALLQLPGGAIVNPLSASLTWQVSANIDDNNQLTEVVMSKIPYHSFAHNGDTNLENFANNLDNEYEIAKPHSHEKAIFNKLNSLGNGEGHILAQAFDQMRGHIYGGVQQRIKSTSDIIGGEVAELRADRNVSKDSNKIKAFGQRNEYKTDTGGIPDWSSNAGGVVYVHEDETVRLGQSSGWYAGVTNNYFRFKDLARSYENQAMLKAGVFKSIPLDGDGTVRLNLGGDGFFGRNDMKRKFWVVDQEFQAESNYYSYGAGLNAGLEKEFVVNDGFSIVPKVGIRTEYGRFSSIHENGDMALNVKSNDYISVKPSAGIDFKYNQKVFKNTNLTASLGFSYESEIGKLDDVENEARITGAWTDYFGIKGDKENKKGNFKSDLKLGIDNGRLGLTVNTGYDTKGHNFRAGLGLKVMY